jgi:hypothetical protein
MEITIERRMRMNPATQNAKSLNYHARPTRLALALAAVLTMLSAVVLVSVRPPRAAAQSSPRVTFASVQGPWALALVGNTGCGITSMYVSFNLNASGVDNNATLQFHSTGCADSTTTQTFVIQTLNPDGSGTANLSCGPGCGWDLNIQVMLPHPGVSQAFTAADVAPENPDNVLAGTAVRKT